MAIEISRDMLVKAFQEIKPLLLKDKLFIEEEYGNDINRLEAYISNAPNTYEEFISKFLYSGLRVGMEENFYEDPYMYACLMLLKKILKEEGAFIEYEDLVFEEGDCFFFPEENVIVNGGLLLKKQAIGIFLGNVIVKGNYYGDGFYNLLAISGKLIAKNIFTAGEIIATQSIEAVETACFIDNDYAARSPLIKADILIELDRYNAFSERNIKHHINETYNISEETFNKSIQLFGAEAIEIDDQEKHMRREYFIEKYKPLSIK